jgi:hypothetical protein
MTGRSFPTFNKSDRVHSLHDSFDIKSLETLIGHDVVNAGQMTQFSHDISSDKDGRNLASLWESLKRRVCNGSHKRSLSGIISSQKTIFRTTLQFELGVVQKNLGTWKL